MKRIYWRPHKVSRVELAIVVAAAVLGLFAVEHFRATVEQPHFEKKVAAARLARQAFEVVKSERLARGWVISPETDPMHSGVIGPLISPVTSNTGVLPAKQSSVNPNFAAVMVAFLERIEVQRGDLVAVAFSGSFPALNIAVLAALETLGVEAVAISSASASQFGANDPNLLWIDMEHAFVGRKLFGNRSVAASLGGLEDAGVGLDEGGKALLLERIRQHGLQLLMPESLSDAVEKRMAVYRDRAQGRPYKAYINVGGGSASVGTHIGKKLYRPGLNRKAPRGAAEVDSVMNRFAFQGVPVIHLVRLKTLVGRYGFPWQPTVVPAVGEGKVYVREAYNLWLVGGVAVTLLLLLLAVIRTDLGYRLMRLAGGANNTRPPEQMV